ncbi:ead/Ea22-like family protein [Pseudomonas aeruginosa]
MTDHAELRRLAKAATPGPWTLYVPEDYQGPEELPGYGVECAEGRAIVWGALEPETGCQFDRDAEFIAAANPKTILAMLDEIDGLRSRLEIDERTPHDGIACRDETIKVLDEKCDRLKAENERLSDELSACTEHPGGCGYWREAAKRRAEERDRLREENEALRKDAERWRYARTILPYEVIQDAQKDLESWNVGVSEAENKRCDEAIDAALKGATQ